MAAMVVEEADSPAVISFGVPSGFAAPDNVEEGDFFETVARVKIKDGQVILDSINGSKIGPEEDEMEEESEDEEEEMEDDEEEPETLGEEDTLGNAMKQSGIGY